MIYFIKAGRFVKIGFSNDPVDRLKSLQTGCPEQLKLMATMPGDGVTEKSLHEVYKRFRIRGEWFKYDGALKWAIIAASDGATPIDVVDVRSLQQAGLHLQARQHANRDSAKRSTKLKDRLTLYGN